MYSEKLIGKLFLTNNPLGISNKTKFHLKKFENKVLISKFYR
jgi:hypothetical protein